MIQRIKKYWYIFIIFALAGIVFFYQRSNIKSKVKKEDFYVVKKQTLKETLSIAGEINAQERALLKFQTSGLLSWVGVKKGDRVKKFQGIATLDQRELEKNLKKYLNTYMKTRWDYDQTNENYKNMAISDAMKRIIDKAQYDLDNSVIDVELKNIALQYSYLYTPIEGIVIRVDAPYAGVNITPTTAEFEVVNPNTVYFSANADQTEVVRLSENMEALINLDAYPETKLKGSIDNTSFTPKQGETATVYEVKIKMSKKNSDYKYKLGMTGDAIFDLSVMRNVLSVPTSYIKTENNKKYVWLKVNNKKVKQYIRIGREADDDTQVISGLKTGDIIYD